jgi:hypothetical protein
VLDAVLLGVDGDDWVDGVDEALPTPCWATTESGGPAGGSSSTPGVGRASLPEAQAREAANAKDASMWIDDGL